MAEKKDKKPRRKVVLSYVEDRSKGAFSITVPTKWEAQPVTRLVEYWAKLWNDKNGATPLDAAALELVVEGKKVGGDEILREAVPHFVEAVAVRRRAAPSAAKPAPTLAPTPPAAAPPPDDARAQFRARAEARKKAGDDRFRKRDWAGAIEALTDARKAAVLAEETSMLESVALNLSLAHLQSGDAKKAEAEATGLLYRAPGHGKALFRRGVARMKRGDRPAAAADLEGALRAVASGPGAPSPAEVAQIERALAQCRRRPAAAAAPPVKKGFLAAPAKAAPLARPPRVRAVARGLIPLDVRDVEDLLAPLSDGYVAPAAPPKPKPADEGTARYVIVDGKIVDASQAAALRAAADAGGGGFGDSRAGAVLREDAELKLRELHGGMAVFGVQGAHNTAAKRDAHVRRAREDARKLAPALGAGHAHARFFEAFCAMTLDDGERQRAHDDAFARGERPAGLGPRSEAVFDAWRAAWAVYAAPETPESGSLHLKTQCMDFMTKCYLEAAPPRHLEAYDLARDGAERAAAGDAAPHVRAGVLAQALREATGDGRHARVAVGHFSAGLDADAASDDAALELMIALQNDFSDMDAARLCAERHIDGCAAARRACRWADAWQRPGVYSAPSLLRSAAAWPDPKLAETVVGAVAGAFPMIMEEVLELYGGRSGARKRDWPRAGASGSSSDGARARAAAGRADVDPSWREVVLVARAGGDGVTEAAAAACPRTIGLLNSLDAVREAAELGVAEVVLSALGPGTELKPDTGATNLRLTAHLCLLAPKTDRPCELRCGDPGLSGSSRRYAEGAVLLYDDSFEHAAVHDGAPDSGDRVVLSVQFFHPRLSRSQRQAEVRSALEAVQRRKIKTQFGSLATEAAIRNATHEALGNALM